MNATTVTWISVKERLPAKEGAVIVFVESRNPSRFQSGVMIEPYRPIPPYWRIGLDSEAVITHWLPLPKPPRED